MSDEQLERLARSSLEYPQEQTQRREQPRQQAGDMDALDQFVAEHEREAERAERRTPMGWAGEVAKAPARGLAGAAGATVRGSSYEVERARRGIGMEPRPVEETPLYRAGDAIDQGVREGLPVDPDYAGTFGIDAAEGAGSLGFYAGLGLLTRGAGAKGGAVYAPSVASAGAAGQDEAYQNIAEFARENPELARAQGIDDDFMLEHARRGTPGGVIQVLPAVSAIRPMTQGISNQLLRRAFETGLNEFTVENAGALYQNHLRQEYDEDHPIWEHVPYRGQTAAVGSVALALALHPLTRRGERTRGISEQARGQDQEVPQDAPPEMQAMADALEEHGEDATILFGEEMPDSPEAAIDRFTALYGTEAAEAVEDSPDATPRAEPQAGMPVDQPVDMPAGQADPFTQPQAQEGSSAQDGELEAIAGKPGMEAPQQTQPARRPARARRNDVVDPAQDNLLKAIGKYGGIDQDEAIAQGLDPANWKGRPGGAQSGVFGKPWVRAKGQGRSLDDLAESLAQDGYFRPDEQVGANTLLDKITDHLAGNEQFAQTGIEAQAERHAAEEAELAADREGDALVPLDWESEGFTDADFEQSSYPALTAEERQAFDEYVANAEDRIGPDRVEEILENAARTSEGLSDREYQNTVMEAINAQTQQDGQPDAGEPGAGEAGSSRGADQQAPTGEGFGLQTQTEEGLAQQQAEQDEAARQAEQRAIEQQQRIQADRERDSFELTGSTAPADRMPGQADAFSGGMPTAAPTQTPDRRQDTETRRRVAEMDPEEMRRALLVDDLTGLGNRRAYDEAEKKDVQVSIDVDALKWVNDNMSHQAGDELLAVVGGVIGSHTNEGYHVSGDEFIIQADTDTEAQEVMAAVEGDLARAKVEATLPSGETVTYTGLGVSYGKGSTLAEAEQGLQEHKQERERAGLRSSRGGQPGGVVRTAPEGDDDQSAPSQEAPAKEPPVTQDEINRLTQSTETPAQAGVSRSGESDQAERFTPTHVLPSGEEVRATDEPGVYENREGVEIEDANAEPITESDQGTGNPLDEYVVEGVVTRHDDGRVTFDETAYRNAISQREDEVSEAAFNARNKGRWVDSMRLMVPDADYQALADHLQGQDFYHGGGAAVAQESPSTSGSGAYFSTDADVARSHNEAVGRYALSLRRPLIVDAGEALAGSDASIGRDLRSAGYDAAITPDGGEAVVVSQGAIAFQEAHTEAAQTEQETQEPEPEGSAVDQAASEAEPEPTEAQKEAGNYRKGHINLHGLRISIENARGSVRRGTDPDGNEWETTLAHHYGDINGTEGADADPVDVFLGHQAEDADMPVFIIDQHVEGQFDEHKVMIGFPDEAAARKGYLDNYEDGWSGLGEITETTLQGLRSWLESSDTTAPAAEAGPDTRAINELHRMLRAGERFGGIREARKKLGDVIGEKIVPGTSTAKRAEELLEAAAVMRAREIVGEAQFPQEAYRDLVDLQETLPNLSTRTSTSVSMQAYSTPLALSFAASHLSGISEASTVYEPSAGHGALLMQTTDAQTVIANELDPGRAERLAVATPHAEVTSQDATVFTPDSTPDAVIANPPFGAAKDASGKTRKFEVGGHKTSEIDHAIVLQSLDAMSDNGRAALIIGGVQGKNQDARETKYQAPKRNRFYKTLYDNYNVTGHGTVAGDLYSQQGASYPVELIIIEGKGASALKVPGAEAPPLIETWDQLGAILNDPSLLVPASRKRDGSRPGLDTDGDGPGVGSGLVLGDPGAAGADAGGSGAEPGAGGATAGGRSGSGELAADATADTGRRGADADSQQPAPGGLSHAPGARSQLPGDRGSVDAASAESVPADAPRRVDQSDADGQPGVTGTERQSPYRPASKSKGVGTLVPVNMRSTTQRALEKLANKKGDLDNFVAEALNMDPATIGDYFSAEQVDALALALENFDSNAGFIIGDQTGVGKGRIVAGIIRYAIQQGRTPIFVTEKPNLYADMFRDLNDIGFGQVKMLPTNPDLTGKEAIQLDDEGKHFLRSMKKHNQRLEEMAASGDLQGHDVIFTTYSQFQPVGKNKTVRNRLLERFADGGVVIFDESHNAGGQGASSGWGESETMSRASVARELAALAHSVMYSSATYAKRPDVMDLYFRTDMGKAVDDISQLPEAINAGGVPLQQVVASMLSETGQYMRRERSFEGVTYETAPVEVDTALAENVSAAMGAVHRFDTAKEAAVKKIKKDAAQDNKRVGLPPSVGEAGMTSNNFTSVMHNLIDQMLLALKMDATIDKAEQAIKEGRKPVITVANTMGSFVKQFAHDVGLQEGDPINLSFNNLLNRYLEKSREVLIKDDNGNQTRRRLKDDELGPALGQFREAQRFIANMDLSGIPVSPIDYLRSRLQERGISTAEITGRQETIDYTGEQPTYRRRPQAEVSVNGRRQSINKFNDGTTQAIILNQAGSTGISLHASEKFKNRSQREMIIAQAEKNIDTHMQMLGRVHRTGQVVTPVYRQLVANIPAEKRPASVLAKKMASLNANTTASRGSDLTAENVPDFMNEYGDEVAASLMEENPEIARRLGDPLKGGREDAMRKVTGRLPLLPVAEQESVYRSLESEYADLLQQLEQDGTSPLEAKTLDLDARTVETREVAEGDPESDSPFAGAAMAEIVDMKRTGKPMRPHELMEAIRETVESTSDDAATLQAAGEQWLRAKQREAHKQFETYEALTLDNISDTEQRGRMANALDASKRVFNTVMRDVAPGSRLIVSTDNGTFDGVVLGVEQKGNAANPLAPSDWRIKVAVADAIRTLNLPFSKIGDGPEKFAKLTPRRGGLEGAAKAFESQATESREQRTIITGNLLSAYGKFGRGQIINFSDNQGQVRQGILMPKDFDLDAAEAELDVRLRTAEQAMAFMDEVPGGQGVVGTPDGHFSARPYEDGYRIITPASKAKGGKYYLNNAILEAAGDEFVTAGANMRMDVGRAEAERILRVVMEDNAVVAKAHKDEARAVIDRPAYARSRSSERPQGLSAEQVRRQAGRVLPGWKGAPRISVVDNILDLPPSLLRAIGSDAAATTDVRGIYYQGQVHLVAANLRSNEAVQRTVLHEVVGHYGLRQLMGDDLKPLLEQVWQEFGHAGHQDIIDVYFGASFDPDNEIHRYTVAEERLAHLAEDGASPGLLMRLRAAVQRVLRRLGFTIRLNNADLVDLLRRARQGVERQAGEAVVLHGDSIRQSTVGRVPAAPTAADVTPRISELVSRGHSVYRTYAAIKRSADRDGATPGMREQLRKAQARVQARRKDLLDAYDVPSEMAPSAEALFATGDALDALQTLATTTQQRMSRTPRPERYDDVMGMTLEAAEAEVSELLPRVEMAYERGYPTLAERLDDRLERLMDRLEAGLSEREEDGVTLSRGTEADVRLSGISPELTQPGDPVDGGSGDLLRDLAARYYDVTEGNESRWATSEADQAELLRGVLQDYAHEQGGLREDVTDAQVLEAARDAYQRIGENRARVRAARDRQPPQMPMYSRTGSAEVQKRQRNLLEGIFTQPIDRMFRAPFTVLGQVDSHGRMRLGVSGHDAVRRAITEWQPSEQSSFAFMRPVLESMRAGLIDRYGLTQEFKQREALKESDKRRIQLMGADILQQIQKAGVSSPREAAVLQGILAEGDIPDADWAEISEPIRRAIDELGQELVNLGLISPESYLRNTGQYLHRSYRHHEGAFTGASKWMHDALTKRRQRIQGDALKERGMRMPAVTQERLLRDAPQGWWGQRKRAGKADVTLEGQKFVVLDQLTPAGEGVGTLEGMEEGGPRRRRVKQRVYWPADQALPAKYQAWENRGTWEVRGAKGGKLSLWRDFTRQERLRMGEIVDARFNIAKTFQVLANDIAEGRFYRDIAKNPEWARTEGQQDGRTINAEAANRLATFAGVDWVKVPSTEIPGSQAKRWGDLAGMYVKPEIWRDINELDRMQNRQNGWRKLLQQWKANKTARSPVVHMNNVMSNLMLMDMIDVRMVDLVGGIREYAAGGDMYREAMENGAFGGTFVNEELRKNIFEPLIDEIRREALDGQGSGFEARASLLSRMSYRIWDRVKKADRAMTSFYQVEDELFRMATYMRRRSLGDSPQEAAITARDQFLNYDIRAPWVNAVRTTVLPFISYTYRAVPAIAQALSHRPWKFAKYATIAYLVNWMSYELSPGDEDEERRTMREEMQGNTWIGMPRTLRMPYRDQHDNPVFLDVRRWIPAGDVFDMHQGQIGVPAPLQFGGPLMLVGELMLNRAAFTGQDIVDQQTDTAWDKTRKRADWFWKAWTPSAAYIPGSWHNDSMARAITGGLDPRGRQYSLAEAALAAHGIRARGHDVDLGYQYRAFEIQKARSSLEQEMRALQRNHQRNLISERAYTREVANIRNKLRDLQQQGRELQGR